MYQTTRPGWNIETIHPTVEPDGDVPVCEQCSDMIDPTLAFAVDWGSTSHGSQIQDPDGIAHVVYVRADE